MSTNEYSQVIPTSSSSGIVKDYHEVTAQCSPENATGYATMIKPGKGDEPYIHLSSCRTDPIFKNYPSGEYLDGKELNGREWLEEKDAAAYYSTIDYGATLPAEHCTAVRKVVALVAILFCGFLLGLLLWFSIHKTEPTICSNVSSENLMSCRRDFIRNLTRDAYRLYAWSAAPGESISYDKITGSSQNTMGWPTVVAMSTLFLMDLQEEWNLGAKWINEKLNISAFNGEAYTLMITSDHLGGLLAAYALTGNLMFLNQSQQVVKVLEAAFAPSTGMLNLKFIPKQRQIIGRGLNALSTIGFQNPQLIYYAALFGDETMKRRLRLIRSIMENIEKPNGLYLYLLDVNSGQSLNTQASLSVFGNVFFYNLLRSIIQSGGRDQKAIAMYTDAIEAMIKMEMFKVMDNGRLYLRDYETKGKIYGGWMDSSGCQMGAMLALGARMLQKRNDTERAAQHMELAINLTETCHQTAHSTATKLLPEKFMQSEIYQSKGIIRSDLAESYFILWRLIGDSRFREYAWELALAYYQYSRTARGGFAEVVNVNSLPVQQNDNQQTIVLSGTFKYLYLIFGEDPAELSLDEWVFTDTGHPLPICGTSGRFRRELC